jgi:hypothetical protein
MDVPSAPRAPRVAGASEPLEQARARARRVPIGPPPADLSTALVGPTVRAGVPLHQREV